MTQYGISQLLLFGLQLAAGERALSRGEKLICILTPKWSSFGLVCPKINKGIIFTMIAQCCVDESDDGTYL